MVSKAILSRMRFFLFGAALLLSGAQVRPDTIVLKNGRRITALSAVEEGDKVRYQTSAGELSLPKSIVDHIEKGGFAAGPGSPGDAAANLTIAPPEIRPAGGGIERVERGAVGNSAGELRCSFEPSCGVDVRDVARRLGTRAF